MSKKGEEPFAGARWGQLHVLRFVGAHAQLSRMSGISVCVTVPVSRRATAAMCSPTCGCVCPSS